MDLNDRVCKEKLEAQFKYINYYDPWTGNGESIF